MYFTNEFEFLLRIAKMYCTVQMNLNFIANINIHKCIAKMYCTNEFGFYYSY
jgi:hypothetical protein